MGSVRVVDSRLKSLKEFFREHFLTDPVALYTYEIDAANDRGVPDGVIFPTSVDDVVQAVRIAEREGLPLIPRGAGTGLSGGAVAEHGGVIIEFSRLNRILELDHGSRSVLVEPGLVNLKLDEYVKKAGLYFPPDPASGRSATIGGNLAENAGGPHCFKYGVMTNYVTGLQVVLANGSTLRLGGPAYDYPEYNFSSILIGSEGTLGIITQGWLRLLRNPSGVKTLMVAFNTVEDAGQAVSAIIARGLVPATMEFMDQRMMRIIEDYAHAGLPVESGAALIIEVDGFPASLDNQVKEIVEILHAHAAENLRIAQTVEERERIWYGRKSAAGAMARLSPAYYLLDGTVPRSRLAEALAAVNKICASLELRVAYVFHAGDGNLHPFILIEEPGNPLYMQRVHQAGEEIMQACVDRGGSITGEHGVGIEKRRFMPMMYGPAELSAMSDIKRIFDPANLMNPGKIFPLQGNSGIIQPAAILISTDGKHPRVNSVESPQNAIEAAEIIRSFSGEGARMRVVGGETKSAHLPQVDIRISTHGMRSSINYALEDLYIEVGAGMPLVDLQAMLLPERMQVPLVSPWQKSTVGGVLSTNFNAPLRMRFGGLKDLLLAVEAVLPDGRVVRVGRPVVKNVAGYDLQRLFVGAYGTLGLVTGLTWKISPLPRLKLSLVIPIEDLAQGLELGNRLLSNCLSASALLLVSHSQTNIALEQEFATDQAPYTLIYSAEGQPEDVRAELDEVRGVLRQSSASQGTILEYKTGNDLWAEWLRSQYWQEGSLLRLGIPPGRVTHIREFLPTHSDILVDFASGMIWLSLPPNTEISSLTRLAQKAYEWQGYLLPLAGPILNQADQDGLVRPPDSLELMRTLKARWDPQGLFNPSAFPGL